MTSRNTKITAGVGAVALVLTMVPQLAAYAWPLWFVALAAIAVAAVLAFRERRKPS